MLLMHNFFNFFFGGGMGGRPRQKKQIHCEERNTSEYKVAKWAWS
jgi:hypothetical protein